MTHDNWILGPLYALVAVAVTAGPAFAQQDPQKTAPAPVHATSDWSDRHVIFSPAPDLGASQNQQDKRFWQDERYWRQEQRRSAPAQGLADRKGRLGLDSKKSNSDANGNADGGSVTPTAGGAPVFNTASAFAAARNKLDRRPPKVTAPGGDWNLSLGPNAASRVAPGMFPAKFSFDISQPASCTDDYVIFAENRAEAAATSSVWVITFVADNQPNAGTLTIGTVSYIYGTNSTLPTPVSNTCQVFTQGGAATTARRQTAQSNLYNAITSAGSSSGAWACNADVAANADGQITNPSTVNTTGTGTITFTSAAPGTVGQSLVSEAITDLSVAQTTIGNDGQPSIVGLNNLYAGPATTASVTGTFTGNANSQPVTITNGANALVLTGTANTGTARISFGGTANSGSSISVGGKTYLYAASCTTTANCVDNGGNSTESAASLTAAIMADSGLCIVANCFGSLTTANTSVTASRSGTTVTLQNITAGTLSITESDPGGDFSYPDGTSIAVGGNLCSSATVGTVINNATASTQAANLAAAIAACGTRFPATGVTATANAAVVTVSALAAGLAGNSITVGDSMTNFSWNFASLTGGTDAGVCTGPTVAWSYRTSGGGAVTTSPILYSDGTKVAFIESLAGGSVLRVIRLARDGSDHPATEGTIVSPASPLTSVASWSSCPNDNNSCMVSFQFNSTTVTNSSPYYDYTVGSDTLYVGDDNGILWKITGVFNGTPATATGWTSGVTVSGAGADLTGPVLDLTTMNIFVGDSAGGMSYVRDTGSTKGTCIRAPRHAWGCEARVSQRQPSPVLSTRRSSIRAQAM